MKRSDIPAAAIFAACDAYHRGEAATPEQALADKYPPKLVLARMAQLVKRGDLNYRVSLRTAWVVTTQARPQSASPVNHTGTTGGTDATA